MLYTAGLCFSLVFSWFCGQDHKALSCIPPSAENVVADFPPLSQIGEPAIDRPAIDAEMDRSGFLHTPCAPVPADEGEKKRKQRGVCWPGWHGSHCTAYA